MGRDVSAPDLIRVLREISIHAPRVGRDQALCGAFRPSPAFQSTRPVWGATIVQRHRRVIAAISIHAPRVGRDVPARTSFRPWPQFQSTRPVWGATADASAVIVTINISIHAPRVGRDNYLDINGVDKNISIHAPRVGRDDPNAIKVLVAGQFQSTRPVWGATREGKAKAEQRAFQSTRPVWGATFVPLPALSRVSAISIHAPRVGRDAGHAARSKR